MAYAATIFLSSFLLFLVQPLIARQILPWFGGTAAVWTTCMLFFQTLLLAGYAYAHATSVKLQPRAQAAVHTVLLGIALALLPIDPDEMWKPAGTEEPISRILLVLAATVGLPYLLLASTSPLLAAWFARARPGVDPYRLFAVSNLASLLALIGYPLVVEPFLGNREQVVWWSVVFAFFAVLCAGLSWSVSGKKEAATRKTEDTAPPRRKDYLLWLALSATGTGRGPRRAISRRSTSRSRPAVRSAACWSRSWRRSSSMPFMSSASRWWRWRCWPRCASRR